MHNVACRTGPRLAAQKSFLLHICMYVCMYVTHAGAALACIVCIVCLTSPLSRPLCYLSSTVFPASNVISHIPNVRLHFDVRTGLDPHAKAGPVGELGPPDEATLGNNSGEVGGTAAGDAVYGTAPGGGGVGGGAAGTGSGAGGVDGNIGTAGGGLMGHHANAPGANK